MAKTSRMGNKITFTSHKGNALKGGRTSHPHLHYGMFQIVGEFVQ